jgi:DNA-binding NarL/FixJ family response regulator
MNKSIRILLADNHALVRQGLRALLEKLGYHVINEAQDGQEALRLASQTSFDIAILDVTMPILNGIDAARELHKSSPKTKTILLTRHDEDPYVTEALRAGVKGYVLKDQMLEDLDRAIQKVGQGSIYLSPGISRAIVDSYLSKTLPPADPLSSRQRQVVQLLGEGRSSKEIAKLLGISSKTVDTYRSRLMQKLGIHGAIGLVRYAIRRGLIQP